MRQFDRSAMGRYVGASKTADNKFGLEWLVTADVLEDPVVVTDLGDYVVEISHSESPETGFEYIMEPNPDPDLPDIHKQYSCDTVSAAVWNKTNFDFNRHFYFRFELITGGAVVDTVVKHCFGQMDGVAAVVAANERLLYRNWAGYPASIWRRKAEGTHCPECWNPYTQSQDKSHCETCQGTGFTSGYYDAVHTQISFEYGNRVMTTTQTAEETKTEVQARMTNYPMVRPGDVVMNNDTAQRFVIKRVQTTQLPNIRRKKNGLSGRTFVISQILFLTELSSSDTEYSRLTP